MISTQAFSDKFCAGLGIQLLVSALLVMSSVGLTQWSIADEGMLPISELHAAELAARGIHLQSQDIFSPGAVSLVDGVVRVNGCTGSFVSADGLILTNHHCAYRAIQTNSVPERDLLVDGFVAATRNAELPAAGYTVRITQSYRDVSGEILGVVSADMDFTARTQAIERQSKLLEQQAERENPGLRAEVAEMFIGETYGLFLYVYLRDVRLVFAPPSAVGNFGGEVDNWHWPRHTGDFAFMRAYTAPDGSAADYSPDNIPYRPRRHLKVKAEGVQEGDTVFLLGYPGRTARHHTSDYLAYVRDVMLPWTIESNQWQIAVMEEAGKADRSVALKHANRIKSLANVEKRSRGQLQGLQRASLIESRQAQEEQLQSFIKSESERNSRYGQIIQEIADVYDEMKAKAAAEFLDRSFVDACRTLFLAYQVYDAAVERQKPDLEREASSMERNIAQTIQQWRLAQQDLDVATDEIILTGLLQRLIDSSADPAKRELQPADLLKQPVAQWFQQCRWNEPEFLDEVLQLSPAELARHPDPALRWVVSMYPRLTEIRRQEKERQGKLNRLYGDLITVKKQFQASQFVPDANGTLRLTSGTVKGFSPEDGLVKTPFTTLSGILQKTTGVDPFVTPDAVLYKIMDGEFGGFDSAQIGSVPVNLLYDTDTTGGNSGSPIMDASGRLVGVNFDRAFEATINDFAWSPDYSRSIGVDIRYVLWITGTVFDAKHLLVEMGVGVPTRAHWIFLTSGSPPAGLSREEIEQMQAEHLGNFRHLHSMGILDAAGPLGDPERVLRGMVYVKLPENQTPPQNQAMADLFQSDPFIQNKLLNVAAWPIADQIGGFRDDFSLGEMEEFQLVAFQSPAGTAIEATAAQEAWQHLQELYQPDKLRFAARFAQRHSELPYLGVAIFKKSEIPQLEEWLKALQIAEQKQVTFSIIPLYLSRGILD